MGYVRNAWYVAGWHDDVADRPYPVSILGERIVLWRSEGRLVALEDRCIHRFAPLSLGRCEAGRLRCMYHGIMFDADGAIAEIPGQDIIPPNARARSYPVVEKHSWIWVWMGEAARADEALVPPAVGLDDPNFILGRGHLDYAAEARLINDNLTDFSHLSFGHANSFQTGMDFADRQPKITPVARGIRVDRWNVNAERRLASGENVFGDTFASYDFLIPGVLLMWSGSYPAGTAERLNFETPDFDDAIAAKNFTSQAVTPTGDKTSCYFFSWGPDSATGTPELRDAMMALAGMAFNEDKVMIEAQQRVIDGHPAARIMPTAHDRGVGMFNRLVDSLARAETESAAA